MAGFCVRYPCAVMCGASFVCFSKKKGAFNRHSCVCSCHCAVHFNVVDLHLLFVWAGRVWRWVFGEWLLVAVCCKRNQISGQIKQHPIAEIRDAHRVGIDETYFGQVRNKKEIGSFQNAFDFVWQNQKNPTSSTWAIAQRKFWNDQKQLLSFPLILKHWKLVRVSKN